MEIVTGKTKEFCSGVSNALKKVEMILDKREKVYCLGKLIHNNTILENLKSKGLKIIEDINEVPNNSMIVIGLQGASKQIYKVAKEKDIELYNLTCPKILKLHSLVEEYVKSDYYILLIGGREHFENKATISFAGEKGEILQDKEEIDKVIEKIRKSGAKKLLIVAQTTFSVDKFNEYITKIKNKINFNLQIEVVNTICDSDKSVQEQTKEIARNSELMIIIGAKNSPNAIELYDIAVRSCNNAMHVETKEDLYMNYIRRFEKVGVVAGVSTTKENIDEIMSILKRG